MGNKQRIADEIINSILNFTEPADCFVDLFCGSCSVIERVSPMFFPIRIANDKNVFLIAMLKSLQRGIKFPETITKEKYAEMRTKYNLNKKRLISLDAKEIAEIGWYGWMGSFNGRFFDGGYSGHNVNGRDYISEQIRNTLRQIPKLKDVMF